MRNRAILICVGLLFLLTTCMDSTDTYQRYFIKYFGADGDHEAADLVVNTDGTMVLIGTTEFPANSGITKVYVAKTTPDGKVLWDMTFGDGTDVAQDIERTPTGYIILANVINGPEQRQIKLIRIGDDGDKLDSDSLVYDLLDDQWASTITPLSDGGYYIVGNTFDYSKANADSTDLLGSDIMDLLYIRISSSFVLPPVSSDRVGKSSLGVATKVFETDPGVFFTAEYSNRLTPGETSTAANYEENFWFRNFTFNPQNSTGVDLNIGDASKEEYLSQTVAGDNGYFFSVGTSVGLSSNVLVTKTISLSGGVAKEFENSFGTDVEGVSINPGTVSCYVLANAINESDGTRDIWLTKINAFTGDQDPAWVDGVKFGSATNDDTGKVVTEAPNGDIVILGTMTITNQKKIVIIKLSKSGSFTP